MTHEYTTGDGITIEHEILPADARWDRRVEVSHPATNIRPAELFCGGQATEDAVVQRLLHELHGRLAECHPDAAERRRYRRLIQC